jgi:hypothetical protein
MKLLLPSILPTPIFETLFLSSAFYSTQQPLGVNPKNAQLARSIFSTGAISGMLFATPVVLQEKSSAVDLPRVFDREAELSTAFASTDQQLSGQPYAIASLGSSRKLDASRPLKRINFFERVEL